MRINVKWKKLAILRTEDFEFEYKSKGSLYRLSVPVEIPYEKDRRELVHGWWRCIRYHRTKKNLCTTRSVASSRMRPLGSGMDKRTSGCRTHHRFLFIYAYVNLWLLYVNSQPSSPLSFLSSSLFSLLLTPSSISYISPFLLSSLLSIFALFFWPNIIYRDVFSPLIP